MAEDSEERFYALVSECENYDDHPAPKNAKWYFTAAEPYSYGFAYEPVGNEGIRIIHFLSMIPDLGERNPYSVVVPDTIDSLPVVELGESVFYKEQGLISVSLPRELKKIETGAFFRCSLKELSLPASVREIEEGAFCYNPDLTTVSVEEANPVYAASDGVLYKKDGTVLLYYPEGKTDEEYEIPATVTRIADYAFGVRPNPALRYLTVPASVKEFGEGAFWNSFDPKDLSVTLRVYAGSAAQTYADTEGLPYEVISQNSQGDFTK